MQTEQGAVCTNTPAAKCQGPPGSSGCWCSRTAMPCALLCCHHEGLQSSLSNPSSRPQAFFNLHPTHSTQ